MKKEIWIMLLLCVIMPAFQIMTAVNASEEQIRSQYAHERASEILNNVYEKKEDLSDRKTLLIKETLLNSSLRSTSLETYPPNARAIFYSTSTTDLKENSSPIRNATPLTENVPESYKGPQDGNVSQSWPSLTDYVLLPPDAQVTDAYHVAVIGDSVAWGNGLERKNTYYYLVADRLRKILNRPVEVKVYAHSGATIVGNTCENINPAFSSGCPTLMDQANNIQNADDIDLILVSGGGNDVGVMNILDYNTPAHTITLLSSSIELSMTNLLNFLLDKTPNAKIIVTNYYPLFGNSIGPIEELIWFLYQNTDAPDDLLPRLKQNADIFYGVSTSSLAKAVTQADNGINRISLAKTNFDPTTNCYSQSDTWLWRLSGLIKIGEYWVPKTDDEMYDYRNNLCDPSKFKDIDRINAIGHPNRSGATEYARAILQEFTDRIGVFRNGAWYLDADGNRAWNTGDLTGSFGSSGDLPVAGDWNSDGNDEIGVFRNGAWYLDYNGDRTWSPSDLTGRFGSGGDLPVAGDWNSDGKDEVGVFRNGAWYLDADGNRAWNTGDLTGSFGSSGDLPVAGDWNSDGKDEVGVFQSSAWYLDCNGDRAWNPLSGDTSGWFGVIGGKDLPVAGDWNSDGKDEIGVFRSGAWYLDFNGDRTWSPGDLTGSFGFSGDLPVAGALNLQVKPKLGTVIVTVKNADGTAAIPNVQIKVTDGASNPTATTDSTGQATLSGAVGTWTVEISATEYITKTETWSIAAGSNNPRTVNLAVDTQATVIVTVKNDAGTVVIPSAQIDVTDGAGNAIHKTTANGQFTITGVSGAWTAKTSATGFVTKTETWSIAPGSSSKTVNLVMEDAVVLVTVKNVAGTAVIPNALVAVTYSVYGSEIGKQATTDSNGQASTTGVSGTWQYSVSASGYVTKTGTWQIAASPATNSPFVNLEADTQATVIVTVKNDAGTVVIPSAQIDVTDGAGNAIHKTTANGQFTITGVSGAWTAKTSATGFVTKTETWSIAPGSSSKTVNLVMEDAVVLVTVKNAAGTAVIPNALVVVTYSVYGSEISKQVTTDSNGQASTTGVSGTWQYSVSASDYVTKTGTWQIAASPATNSPVVNLQTNSCSANNAPTTPSISSGPTSGASGVSCCYYLTPANDPDIGDQVQYTFNWGDVIETIPPYYDPGKSIYACHSWSVPTGSTTKFNVCVKATDKCGKSSDWSNPYSVTITGPGEQTTVYFTVISTWSGARIPGALIKVTDGAGNSKQATTDAAGTATISGISGTWGVTVSATGYYTSTMSTQTSPPNTWVQFGLTPMGVSSVNATEPQIETKKLVGSLDETQAKQPVLDKYDEALRP